MHTDAYIQIGCNVCGCPSRLIFQLNPGGSPHSQTHGHVQTPPYPNIRVRADAGHTNCTCVHTLQRRAARGVAYPVMRIVTNGPAIPEYYLTLCTPLRAGSDNNLRSLGVTYIDGSVPVECVRIGSGTKSARNIS